MRIEITKANGTTVFDLFPCPGPKRPELDGLDALSAHLDGHEFLAVYGSGSLEIIGWIQARGGKAGEGKGRREFRAIRRNTETGAAHPGHWHKTRKAAVSSLEADIRIAAENADRTAHTMTRAENRALNLAAITEAFRTVEVMTDSGTVYATAGEVVENPEVGTVSQEITVTGGRVIGRVIRSGRNEFAALDAAGEIVREYVDFHRDAIAAVVSAEASAVMAAELLEWSAAYGAEDVAEAMGDKPAEAVESLAAEVIAAHRDAEAAETVAAAESLTAATAERAETAEAEHRAEAAGRSAERATAAAGHARRAAAEAEDAAREAGRLALMIRADANPAEVQDAAAAAVAAADAAVRSAAEARHAAELARAYAAEAVQDAPQAPEASTDTRDAPEAVSGAPVAAEGPVMVPVKRAPHGYRPLTPAEASEEGQADRARFLNRQRVNVIIQPGAGRKPAEVTADTPLGADTVPVRTLDGKAMRVHWSSVEAL